MALDFLAIVSYGTYPTVGVTAAQRAGFAASNGLLGDAPTVSLTNNIAGSPLYIITTSVISGSFSIKGIWWVSSEVLSMDIVTNDFMSIFDSSGFPVASKQAKANGDGLELNFKKPLIVNGIIVNNLDGGILYIFV